MSASPAPQADKPSAAAKPSFGRRLKAWWNGEELASAASGTKDAGRQASKKRWGDRELDRLSLEEVLWGEGFTRPEDLDLLLTLVKPMGLDHESTLYYYGCDMGLGASQIAKVLDCYVRCFETDPDLIERARQTIDVAEMDHRVEADALDDSMSELGSEKTRHIFCRNYLWDFPDKADLLGRFREKLQANGQILLVDWMRGDDCAPSDLTALDMDGQSHQHLWSESEHAEAFEKVGLDLRVCEDLTNAHLEIITRRWNKMARPAELETYGAATAMIILEMAEFWTQRALAMSDGRITVKRMLAIRK